MRAAPARTEQVAAARGPRAGGRRGARDGPLSTLTTLTTCQSAARRLVVHTWWFTGIAAKACIGHGSPRSCRNRQEERRIHSPHAPSCQDELGEVDRYVSRTYLGRISGDWLRRPNGAVAGVIAGAIAARRSAEGDGGRGLIRGDELFSFVSLVQDLEHLGAREWRARVARESGVIGGVISGVIGGVISGVISGNLSRKGICAPS